MFALGPILLIICLLEILKIDERDLLVQNKDVSQLVITGQDTDRMKGLICSSHPGFSIFRKILSGRKYPGQTH